MKEISEQSHILNAPTLLDQRNTKYQLLKGA